MPRPSDLVDHYVYRAWGEFGRLLYVGCSKDPAVRLRDHGASRAKWVPLMVRMTVDGPYSYSVARSVEWQAIQTEDPDFNGQTPRALADRRARSDYFNDVMQTAMSHGVSLNDAARHAVIASDFHFADERGAA